MDEALGPCCDFKSLASQEARWGSGWGLHLTKSDGDRSGGRLVPFCSPGNCRSSDLWQISVQGQSSLPHDFHKTLSDTAQMTIIALEDDFSGYLSWNGAS